MISCNRRGIDWMVFSMCCWGMFCQANLIFFRRSARFFGFNFANSISNMDHRLSTTMTSGECVGVIGWVRVIQHKMPCTALRCAWDPYLDRDANPLPQVFCPLESVFAPISSCTSVGPCFPERCGYQNDPQI